MKGKIGERIWGAVSLAYAMAVLYGLYSILALAVLAAVDFYRTANIELLDKICGIAFCLGLGYLYLKMVRYLCELPKEAARKVVILRRKWGQVHRDLVKPEELWNDKQGGVVQLDYPKTDAVVWSVALVVVGSVLILFLLMYLTEYDNPLKYIFVHLMGVADYRFRTVLGLLALALMAVMLLGMLAAPLLVLVAILARVVTAALLYGYLPLRCRMNVAH